MNRCLPRAFALLPLTIAGVCCLGTSGTAFAAVEHTRDSAEEQEYIESKFFPKKGKYLDWIEANKSSNQGFRLMRAGKYQLAVPMFQKAVQRYGYDYSYYEGLGAYFHKLGNLDKAQSSMEIATQMAPRRWGPWYVLGLIRTKQQDYKGALVALKKAKSLRAPARVAAGINELTASLVYKLNNSPALPSTAASASAAPADEPTAAAVSNNLHQKNASTDQPANPYTTIPLQQPVSDPVPPDLDPPGNKAPSQIAPDVKLPAVEPTPKGQ